MYDINTKNIRSHFSFYFMFFLAGSFFLVLMLFSLFRPKDNIPNGFEKVNEIKFIEVETVNGLEGVPTYYYDVNGREYRCHYYNASLEKTSLNDTVYYDIFNPNNCNVIFEKEKKSDDISSLVIFLMFMLLPLSFMTIGGINIWKVFKRLSDVKYLNKHGKLVKNLPYRLENSGITVNNIRIKRPIICYILPSGNVVVLHGDPRFDRKLRDADGCVDLVIDENNPTKYFIDFEINRKSGNLSQDFCNQEMYRQYFQNNHNYINLDSNNNVVNQYNNPYDS